MPLCAPKKVPLTDEWETVKSDLHFVLQKSPRRRRPLRILLKCNGFQIGEFSNEKDAIKEWAFLHTKESESQFDETSEETSEKLLNEIFSKEQEQLHDISRQENDTQIEHLLMLKELRGVIVRMNDFMASASLEEFAVATEAMISISRQLLLIVKSFVSKRVVAAKLNNVLKMNEWVVVDPSSPLDTQCEQILDLNYEELVENDSIIADVNSKLDKLKELHNQSILQCIHEIHEILRKEKSSVDSLVQYVYQIPIVNKEAKLSDNISFNSLLLSLNENTLTHEEIEDEVYCVIENHLSNSTWPISLMLYHVSGMFNAHLRTLIMNETNESDFIAKIKSDLNRIATIFTTSLKMSIPALEDSRLFRMVCIILYDIILSKFYTTLMVVFTNINKKGDDEFLSVCSTQGSKVNRTTFEMSEVGWKVVNDDKLFKDKILPQLQLFAEEHSLRRKYQSLNGLVQSIIDSITIKAQESSRSVKVGADEMMPLLCYSIMASKTRKPFSHLAYLQAFSDESYLMGKYGYLLVSIETALMVILKLNKNSES